MAQRFSPPAQLKMSKILKEFLTNRMEFLEFVHILWEAKKPTIVLRDNKSVTRDACDSHVSDVADEAQFFFTQAENIDESEEQIFERK